MGRADLELYLLHHRDQYLGSPVQPEAGKTYQVAICGVSDQLAAETTVTDSGVVGMDAAKAFFGAYTTISRADTAWS